VREQFAYMMAEIFNFLWKYPRVQDHHRKNKFDKDWRNHPRIDVHETVDCEHDITKKGKLRKDGVLETGYAITIGKGVFIGAGAIVLGPCTIGDHAVIGAGSVVPAGEYEGECIYAGNPAVFKKRITFTE